MKVIAVKNTNEGKLEIYEDIKYIDLSSGIAILVTADGENKYMQISNIKTITE